MIKPLRSRHRIIIVFLAIVIPVLFIAGLIVRQPPPPANNEVPVPSQESATHPN